MELLFGAFAIIPLLLIGLIVIAIVAFASNRSDPDPEGRRPYAIYLVSITFITLFLALFSLSGTVSALTHLALPNHPEPVVFPSDDFGSPDFRLPDQNDQEIRDAVETGVVAVIALLVLALHVRRLRELENDVRTDGAAARRTYTAYLYVVCFFALLTLIGAAAAAATGLFRIIAPGTTGFGPMSVERDRGIEVLVPAATLASAALAIFTYHWRRAGFFGRPSRARTAVPGVPPPAAPPPAAPAP